jgi:hypothetical protein
MVRTILKGKCSVLNPELPFYVDVVNLESCGLMICKRDREKREAIGKINEILPRRERDKMREEYIAIRKRPKKDGHTKENMKLYGEMYQLVQWSLKQAGEYVRHLCVYCSIIDVRGQAMVFCRGCLHPYPDF